jgi:hypothetical protein
MSQRSQAAVRSVAMLLACACIATTTAARADEAPSVTPYRPSVSTPAALSAAGWIEVEAGGQRLRGDDVGTRDSLPYTVKYAFSPDWGVRLGGEALVHARGAGTQLGDTSLVLKRRFALDAAHAFGLELGATFPTSRELHSGSGRTDLDLNGIYSADLPADLHTDVNLALTRQGAVSPGVGRTQTLVAAAVSGSLHGGWGWVGEYSGTRQSGAPRTAQFLAAASFAPARTVTWDFGVARGLTVASPRWSWFGGVTFLAGRP